MFDIFNIRKCREMREVIEQLTVNLSSERRKYNKATELLDVAKAENSSLKLVRDELSVKVANLGRKLSEEVAKNDDFSRQVCELNADLKKVNSALDESLARRDELSREIEKLTASNNSLKEEVNFLGDTTKRRNATAGRLLEERAKLETKICDLKNENDSLRKKYRKFRGMNFHMSGMLTGKAEILKRFREHYVDYVIKAALMMCEIKESFSQNELCKIFDVGKDVLFKTGIKEEINPIKNGTFLVYPASEVKRFIMESKSLRDVLFNAATKAKRKEKAGDGNE